MFIACHFTKGWMTYNASQELKNACIEGKGFTDAAYGCSPGYCL
jgi:hypothetical protein